MTRYSLLTLLFILRIPGSLAQKEIITCPYKCTDCDKTQSGTKGVCRRCLNSILKDYECYDIDISLTGCLVYGDFGKCSICKKGYIFNFKDFSCIRTSIPTLVMATSVNYWKNEEYSIRVCEGGYPTLDYRDCVSFEDAWKSFGQQPVEKCAWGGRSQELGTYCSRCSEGMVFEIDVKTGQSQCVEKKIPGCVISIGDDCFECDIWDGWYFESIGVCKKLD